MANTIQIKRSSTTTVVPGSLAAGELAINTTDEKLFYANTATTVKTVDLQAVGSALQDVVDDTTPQLGGNLDVNGNSLVSVSNGDITLAPNGTGKVIVSGDLDVTGTTTTINSTTLQIDDKNIELGTVATPTDTTADGGGITLKGTTDKTITWDNTNDNWTFNQAANLSTGLDYKINNASVLNATTLGSGVTASSLTSVGTIGTGTWQGTAVALGYGGTGADMSAFAAGALLKMNGGQTALEVATAGSDYLNDSSTVDGGSF